MAESTDRQRSRKGKSGKVKIKRRSLPYSISAHPSLHDTTVKEQLREHFVNQQSYSDESGIQLHVDPFSVCVMPNLVKEESFLRGLKEELLDLIFHEKNNDLYKFQQTDDFKKITAPHATAIRNLLQDEVLPWLRDVTGIELNNKIDITCSRYDHTDTLLCHDDELDTRRIAFVLYLVPPWTAEDGGALDLYSMDEHVQPKEVVKSILPSWNQFVWFEVTEASHHQVAEILSEDKCRLSVNGWFHTPPAPRPERYIQPRATVQSYAPLDEDVFTSWVNPIYLDPIVQSEIQDKFENESEIELQGFLREEKYLAVKEALISDGISWQKRGPPNKKRYHGAALDTTLPQILHDCLALLQSELFFLTLSNLTGLSLHPLAADQCAPGASNDDVVSPNDDDEHSSGDDVGDAGTSKDTPLFKKRRLTSVSSEPHAQTKRGEPGCQLELRHWEHGDYTLIHDTDSEAAEYALDAMFYCHCPDWDQEYGGYTSYIAKGEDEELLTVVPAENSLALVYRDKDTLRFVKHINSKVRNTSNKHFYDFFGVYFE